MLLKQVFQSFATWQKLSNINMRPKIAYRIFKYIKLILIEYEIAEKQRVALIHEITNTEEGENAKIEPNTPMSVIYNTKFNEILLTEVDLPQLDMDFEETVNAIDNGDKSLTVADLALLEVFFTSSKIE